MKIIQEVAERLRKIADELDSIQKRLQLPVQTVDIPGAFTKLRSVLGGDIHLQIKAPEFDSYSGEDELTMKPWHVYLGINAPNEAHGSHLGATLVDAVNAALAACQPPKEGDPSTEAEFISDALAESLPM